MNIAAALDPQSNFDELPKPGSQYDRDLPPASVEPKAQMCSQLVTACKSGLAVPTASTVHTGNSSGLANNLLPHSGDNSSKASRCAKVWGLDDEDILNVGVSQMLPFLYLGLLIKTLNNQFKLFS
ncbi:unnamed protein product [Protopolystoma xenopodis]|uniref:Uncharacterized protein n=1 Tax=Protopolystoma xenopodis TaxID=117903 RepID=A0A448XEG6_9PLAT|nr:unnamed protein product [Protopolystoma xenopodis]